MQRPPADFHDALRAVQPFARDQAKPFVTGPFLGGYVYLLPAAIAAGGTVVVPHMLRVNPRHVEVIATIAQYPSRVQLTATSTTTASVQFESAQAAGTVLWLW